MASKSDSNLLFGIIALQMDFVRREQLMAATGTWLTDKSQQIEEILVEQGALSEEDRQMLSPLVARHLANHGGDPLQSLAALSSMGSVAEQLRSLGDESIEATLSIISSDRRIDAPEETVVHESQASRAASAVTRDATNARFRILRSHAKGGLGEVYVATDTELRREVALKEIQSKYADDEASRLRFLLEAEVTGGLEHPGIVPVYGLGRYDDGRPFYAMRFIKGDSLQEAADRFHRRAESVAKADDEDSPTGSPTLDSVDFSGLEFRKLLGRFIDVCQAIEYAHSRGVLHRDLKPGNIMLGKYGETLVVDWGLAKAQGRDESTSVEGETMLRRGLASGSAPTIMGSAIGTPAFMPPEQAAGRLDKIGPASDVYSLGATLYYVLIGQPPIRGKDLTAVLKQVQAGDFPPPHEECSEVPKPLNAICLRAMALKPAARYASPQDLADDIERFLADEPVSAFEEPLAVKARRWLRKHQTLTAATAAVVLVSAVGLGVFSTIVSGKNRELTLARQQETKARELAEANEASARQQSQLALTTLTSVIGDIEHGLRNLSGGGEVRRRLLKTSLAKLEEVATEYVGQATVDRQTMMAIAGMGDAVLEFGADEIVAEQASAVKLTETFYRRAHEIATKLAEDDPQNREAQRDLALMEQKLGYMQLWLGNSALALLPFQNSLEIREKLATDDPRNAQAQDDLAGSYRHLGNVQIHLGKSAAALDSYQKSLEICAKLAAEHPKNTHSQLGLASSYQKMGSVQLQSGMSVAALASYQNSREKLEELATDNPENAVVQGNLAISHEKLGEVQQQLGNPDAALVSHQKSCDIRKKLATDDPQNTQVKSYLAISHEKLGDLHLHSGDSVAALASHQESCDIREKLVADDPQNAEAQHDLANSYRKLGDVQLRSDNTDAALTFYQNSREIREKLARDNPNDALEQHGLAVSYGTLGDVQLQTGEITTALTSFQKSSEVLEKLVADDPHNAWVQSDLATAYRRIGDVQIRLGDSAAALAAYQRGVEISVKLAAVDRENAEAQYSLIDSHLRCAALNQLLGEYESAAAQFEVAADVIRQLVDNGRNVEASQLYNLNSVEQAATAAKLATVALGDWDQLLKQPDETLPTLLEMRGIQFASQSRFGEAAQAAATLRELDTAASTQLYNAACVFSLCAASINPADGESLTNGQAAQRDAWIMDAIATLKKAIETGWDDFGHMQKDGDLAVIRDLPEFKALVPDSK